MIGTPKRSEREAKFGMHGSRADLGIGIGLGLAAFAVYGSTRGHGTMSAACAFPFWQVIQERLSTALGGHAADTAGWLCAACGGVAVWLTYVAAKRLLTALAEPDIGLEHVVNAGLEGRSGEGCEQAGLRALCTTCGASVCALWLAFNATFWNEVRAGLGGPLEVLTVLSAPCALMGLSSKGMRRAFGFTLFALGVGAVLSPVLLFAVPLATAMVVRTLIVTEAGTERELPVCLVSGLAGVAVGVMCVLLFEDGADAAARLREYARHYGESIRLSACQGWWPVVWGVPAVLLLVATGRVRSLLQLEDGVGAPGIGLLMALTCVVGSEISKAPFSAAAVAAGAGVLPVVPSLVYALAAGLLFAAWLWVGLVRDVVVDAEHENGSGFMRLLGWAACGMLLLLVLRQPYATMRDWNQRAPAGEVPKLSSSR